MSEYKVVNPATNLLEREFPAATDAEIEQVLDRSARAYQSWRTTAKDERTKEGYSRKISVWYAMC